MGANSVVKGRGATVRNTTFKARLHRNTFLFGAGFCMALLLTMITVQSADAHDIGWRWEYPGVSVKMEARENPYASYVVDGCQNYDMNTDLGPAITECLINSYTGIVIQIYGHWVTFWDGFAEP